MPIIFPRAIPDTLPVASLSFQLDPMIELTPLRSGRRLSLDLGPALWRAKWQSARVDDDQAADVRAWYATLLSAQAFWGWDRIREYPRAYRGGWGALMVGGQPFDGTCLLTAVAGNLVEVTIEQLPAGFVLSPGDYLAWDYGTTGESRALHMVVAAGVADGGGVLSIEVRPEVRIGWAPERVVQLYRPAAKMVIIPQSWSEQTEAPFFWSASFEAIQTL